MVMSLNGPEGPTSRRACHWFTMWREPFERLVSAFLHCRRRGVKAWVPLCGLNTNEAGFRAEPFDMSTVNLTRWAQHYGAYAFRQLLLQPHYFAGVGAQCASADSQSGAGAPPAGYSGPVPAIPSPGRRAQCRFARSWTEHKAALGAGADGQATAAGAAALRDLSAAIASGRLFRTVGLVSRWNESMRLFDAHVPMDYMGAHGRRWTALDSIQGDAHTPEERAQMGQLLREARASPHIRAHLRADLQLYAAAEQLFRRQLAALDSA